MAFKPSETQPQRWILRCYESQGEETILNFKNPLGLTLKTGVNLVEEPQETHEIISPWKIASFALFQEQE
jgi:alpha-mannosidase